MHDIELAHLSRCIAVVDASRLKEAAQRLNIIQRDLSASIVQRDLSASIVRMKQVARARTKTAKAERVPNELQLALRLNALTRAST